MGGSLTSPNKIKDVYKKIVFYDDNKFKVDNGSSDVVITSAENFSSDTEQTLVNKTIDADNNTISNLEVDNLKSGVLDIDIASVAGTDTTIPSAKAVKTYVDSQDATKLLKSNNLSDLTSASTARTNLNVDVSGTDNSTDVTLVGKDYITASGTNNQTLTLGTIDISDDTNLVDGAGITLTEDTLSVDTSVIATKSYVDTQVSTVNTLQELTDTNISSPSDKALLQYDNNTNKWIGVTEIDGGQFV